MTASVTNVSVSDTKKVVTPVFFLPFGVMRHTDQSDTLLQQCSHSRGHNLALLTRPSQEKHRPDSKHAALHTQA